MKEFLNAPGVIRGILMIAVGIIGSYVFGKIIEDNMTFMIVGLGCAVLCLLGVRPIQAYIRWKNEQENGGNQE